MILRRIADGLREQNWFTVVIELFVLALGIVIGLQVDAWNEARKETVIARDYVSQLIVDLDQDIGGFEYALAQEEVKRTALERLAEALRAYGEDESATPEHTERFLIDVRRSTIYGWLATAINDSTFQEMMSSGALTLIDDTAVRKSILDYYEIMKIQIGRTEARRTGYGNMIYRLVPPDMIAVSQLAMDDEILAAVQDVDVAALLAKFRAASLDEYINAELAFTLFLLREERRSLGIARALKNILEAHLAGEDVVGMARPELG